MTKKPVLHELLAVEQGLAETSNRITKDTLKNLAERGALFVGMTKDHTVNDEEKQYLKQATEVKEVQSTVDEQIDYMSNELAQYYDVVFQKEAANQTAKADIVVGETTLCKDVPSIVLLGMEKKLNSLLAVYNAIPTLDTAKSWEPAVGYAKANVWKATYPEERQHTVTAKAWKEVSPATKEHQAQLKEVETTEVIGKYTINNFSGAITSLEKAERIQRLTALIRAVKEARQRANNTEVVTSTGFGKALFDFVNGK